MQLSGSPSSSSREDHPPDMDTSESVSPTKIGVCADRNSGPNQCQDAIRSDIDVVTVVNSQTVVASASTPVVDDDEMEDGQIGVDSEDETLIIDEHGSGGPPRRIRTTSGGSGNTEADECNTTRSLAASDDTDGSKSMAHDDVRHLINEKRRKKRLDEEKAMKKKLKSRQIDDPTQFILTTYEDEDDGMLHIRRVRSPLVVIEALEPQQGPMEEEQSKTMDTDVDDVIAPWPSPPPLPFQANSRKANQRRKFELCKFFVLGHCMKGDHCYFLHSEFPCKYYHLGLEHDPAQCKLAHGPPLGAAMGRALLHHLEKAPPEVLGEDFVRINAPDAAKLFTDRQNELKSEYKCDTAVSEDEYPKTHLNPFDRQNSFKVTISSFGVSAELNDKLQSMGVESVEQLKQLSLEQLYRNDINVAEVYEILNSVYTSKRNVWSNRKTPDRVQNTPAYGRVPVDYSDIACNGQHHAYESPVHDANRQSPPKIPSPHYEDAFPLLYNSGEREPDAYKSPDQYADYGSPQRIPTPTFEILNPINYSYATDDSERTNTYTSPSVQCRQSPFDLSTPNDYQVATEEGQGNASAEMYHSRPSPQGNITPTYYQEKSPEIDVVHVDEEEQFTQRQHTAYESVIEGSAVSTPEDAVKNNNNNSYYAPDLFTSPVKVTPFTLAAPHPTDDGCPTIPIEAFGIPVGPIMPNYVAASEIQASYSSYGNIVYKLNEIYIPFRDTDQIIQNATAHNVNIMADPRLRRIIGKSSPTTTDGSPRMRRHSGLPLNVKPTLSPFVPPVLHSDPRRKPIQTAAGTPSPQSHVYSNSMRPTPPAKHYGQESLDRAAVHASSWYQELSSNHKIMVNQQMAIVSAQLQTFHSQPVLGKLFDFTFVQENPLLQQTFMNLGIFIDENGHCQKVEREPEPAFVQPIDRGYSDGGNAFGPPSDRSYSDGNSTPRDQSFKNSSRGGFHSQSNYQSFRGRNNNNNNGGGGSWNNRRDFQRKMPDRRPSTMPADDKDDSWDRSASVSNTQQSTYTNGNADSSERASYRSHKSEHVSPPARSFQTSAAPQAANNAQEENWDDD